MPKEADELSQAWNPLHYDHKLGFVSEYGKDVVSLLNPRPDEKILDLGCGTGDLSFEISKSGASVVGIDFSEAMIVLARQKYAGLQFWVANGETFRTPERFDAIFSNAALHWMTHPDRVIHSVGLALKRGGRFVAELGGKGVAETVINALETALKERGVSVAGKNPWYFPSIGEYCTLLEAGGFRTTYAVHFDRPTPMEDGDDGLNHWLNGFAGSYLQGLDPAAKLQVMDRVAQLTRPTLYHNGQWVIDYKRLRFMAVRE